MSFEEKFDHFAKLIKKEKVKYLDIKVLNFTGFLKHFTYPVRSFNKELFTDGIGADGSSVGGYATVESSDLRLVPDIETGLMDPFFPEKTLSFLCDIKYATIEDEFPLCPRKTAKRADELVRKLKIADDTVWLPELEFFLFDGYNYSLDPMSSGAEFYSSESDDPENISYKLHKKRGYASPPPYDRGVEFRIELCELLENMGIKIKVNHHECGVPGQHEIEMDFKGLIESCDDIVIAKYVIKNLAAKYGQVATFMPKPIYGIAGSGMHVHKIFLKKGKNIFQGKSFSGLSEMALNCIAGILKHADSITALGNSTTNSYRRLVPGFEAPTAKCYSSSNRTTAIRIPGYVKDPQKKRFEYRPADCLSNPYFLLSSLLCAGVDGIVKKMDPGKPAVGNLDTKQNVPRIPLSLYQALKALKMDNNYLTEYEVFKKPMIEQWIKTKNEEANLINLYPNPAEIDLYFNG